MITGGIKSNNLLIVKGFIYRGLFHTLQKIITIDKLPNRMREMVQFRGRLLL